MFLFVEVGRSKTAERPLYGLDNINRPKTSEFLIIYYEFTGIEGAITVRQISHSVFR